MPQSLRGWLFLVPRILRYGRGMDIVFTVALPVFALIALGLAARFSGALGDGATVALNQFVMLLALPAVLWQAMARIALEDLFNWRFALAFVVPLLAVAAPVLWIGARAGMRLANTTILALAASFANVGYMGIPLCLAAFGQAALAPAVITLVITTVLQFGGALTLVEIGAQPGASWWRALRRAGATLGRNPLLLAPLAGLFWGQTGLGVPVAVDRFLTVLGAAATPCALVAVGLQLGQAGQRFRPGIVGGLVFLKLIAQPALAWVMAVPVLGLPPVWAATAVLMSATPTGSSAFVLARLYDREVAACSGTVLVSTALSFVSLSLLLVWLAHL